MREINGKRVLISGGFSMIGRSVANWLDDRGAIVHQISHQEYDLLSFDDTRLAFQSIQPHYVVHLAGYNGNISFNQKYPSDIFFKTAQMGLNILRCATNFRVEKVVSAISSCSYPDGLEYLLEENFWDGKPHESVDAHGYSKRMLHAYSLQLKKQFNLTSVCVVLNTVYGPYDSYDLNKTKFVGALIKKFVDAVDEGKEEVELWGSGEVKRELLYADDAGMLLGESLLKYENVQLPLNCGLGADATIRQIATHISCMVGYTGDIIWNTSKPDGQKRKLLDVSRMQNELGVLPWNLTQIDKGLTKTIDWYRKNKCKSVSACL